MKANKSSDQRIYLTTMFFDKGYVRMNIINSLNEIMWGRFTIILILVCGVYHTVKSGFIQLKIPAMISRSKGSNRLGAVTSALAASMGTGNITGCAAAIITGGAGAVFWMWISAFFGMALAYSENRTGAEFREKYHENKGPMLYIEKGVSKRLAVIYAAGCLMAAFAMGCMSQAGAFAAAVSEQLDISPIISAAVLFLAVFAVIFSSKQASQAVMKAAQKLVPFMAVLYVGGCVAFLVKAESDIIKILMQIIHCAFEPHAAAGAAVGITVKQAVSVGLRRGIFSNEAGMGSSVLIHSDADFGSPEGAGAWAAFEVFLDTIVCCTLTALVILSSEIDYMSEGDILTRIFSDAFGELGGIFICVCICLFAWAAILGWCCCGEKCFGYLFGDGTNKNIYKLLYCLCAAFGTVISAQAVFGISDLVNCFVMFPNLIAVTYLAAERKHG